MNWLDQMRADHEAYRADFAELRQEMRAMELRIKDEIGGRIQELDNRLTGRIYSLEVKVEQRSADLIKWSFVFWVSAVGAIAALAGVLGR